MIIFKAFFEDAFFVGDCMILIMPDNIEQIINNIDLIDGVILSIRNLSVNSLYTIDIEDLDRIIPKLKGKEVFISLNKNIENSEIPKLEEILLKLNDYPIKGVLYSDVAVITYKDKLNYELIWAQEHLTTNYETINYYHSFGVNYTHLSSDITLDEINDIKKHTNTTLMANLFGYIPMFVSKRHIVKNYLKTFNIDDKSKVNYIEKEGQIYPIIDDNYTYAYSSKILNGIKDYFKMNVDYFVVNGFLIKDDLFSEILKNIKNLNKDNINMINEKINNLFSNTDTLFLHQKTISRVKK